MPRFDTSFNFGQNVPKPRAPKKPRKRTAPKRPGKGRGKSHGS